MSANRIGRCVIQWRLPNKFWSGWCCESACSLDQPALRRGYADIIHWVCASCLQLRRLAVEQRLGSVIRVCACLRQVRPAGMTRIRGACIDLSGTLHLGGTPIPGAPLALAKLRRAGVRILFVSNTTQSTASQLFDKLTGMGFALERHELFTALTAGRELVRERHLQNPLLLLTDDAKEAFAGLPVDTGATASEEAGEPVGSGRGSASDADAGAGPGAGEGAGGNAGDSAGGGASARASAAAAADASAAAHDAVVVGLAPDAFSFSAMTAALRVLKGGESSGTGTPPLIALHKGRYQAGGDGGLNIGPGALVAALEFAAGVEAEVVGKPTPAYFDAALRILGLPASQVVMVGDDVRDDCEGAEACGLSGVLVRTGKYRDGDEEGRRITAVVNDFPAAVEWILERRDAAAPDDAELA